MSAHSIAWELQESKGIVNRILYNLERDGQVERVQLSPPIWNFKQNRAFPSTSCTSKRKSSEKDCSNNDVSCKKRRMERHPAGNQGANEHSDPKENENENYTASDGRPDEKCTKSQHHHHKDDHICVKLSEQISKAVWKKFKQYCKEEERKVILAGFVLKKSKTSGEDDKLE
eukprot:5353032-Ditylum_brightwellii.AAC.1